MGLRSLDDSCDGISKFINRNPNKSNIIQLKPVGVWNMKNDNYLIAPRRMNCVICMAYLKKEKIDFINNYLSLDLLTN